MMVPSVRQGIASTPSVMNTMFQLVGCSRKSARATPDANSTDRSAQVRPEIIATDQTK